MLYYEHLGPQLLESIRLLLQFPIIIQALAVVFALTILVLFLMNNATLRRTVAFSIVATIPVVGESIIRESIFPDLGEALILYNAFQLLFLLVFLAGIWVSYGLTTLLWAERSKVYRKLANILLNLAAKEEKQHAANWQLLQRKVIKLAQEKGVQDKDILPLL